MKKFITISCAIIFMICGFILYGCNENYGDLSLSFSSEKIELTLGEEEKFWSVKINNYFDFDANFQFDFEPQIARVKSIEELTKGEYTLGIVPNSNLTGKATLTITLLEAKNKPLIIPVEIKEKVDKFELIDSLYVLRGQSITLHSSMFTFTPDTWEKDLIFSVGEQVLENGVFTADENTPDVVQITATSAFDSEKIYSFELRVFDQISIENVKLYNVNENGTQGNEVKSYNNEAETNDFIEIVNNDSELYEKLLQLNFDITKGYEYEISSEKGLLFCQYDNSVVMEGTKRFTIQHNTNKTGTEDFLIVKVKYPNFDKPVETLKYKVLIKVRPENVRINGELTSQYFELFTNGKPQLVNFNVGPKACEFNSVRFEFYFGAKTIENKCNYSDLNKYLGVQNSATGDEFSDTMTISKQDISSVGLKLFARETIKEEHAGKHIFIKVIAVSDYAKDGEVYSWIDISINEGAVEFKLDPNKYPNSTIYIKKGEKTVFDDFVITDISSYVGDISIIQLEGNANVVNVSQNKNNLNKCMLNLEGLEIGYQRFRIILANEISTDITIAVVEEFDESQFKIIADSTENTDVAQITYTESGLGTLESVVLRGRIGSGFKANMNFGIKDDSCYEILNPIVENPDLSVVIIDNQIRVSLLNAVVALTEVTILIQPYKIENFRKVTQLSDGSAVELFKQTFTVDSFEPINSLNLSAKNIGLDSAQSHFVTAYNKNSISSDYDKDLANVQLTLDINPTPSNEKLPTFLEKIEWEFSVVSRYDILNEGYLLGDSTQTYGYFYPQTMLFVCESDLGNIVGKSFQIIAKYNEHGKKYQDAINITIEEYVNVDKVWLYNFTDSIYLDSIYNEVVLYPYILPNNATNKDYIAFFEADDIEDKAIVQVEYTMSSVTVRYTGLGGGSGVLKVVPVALYEGSSGEYDVSGCLTLAVNVGDGSQENPLYIRTLNEFLNINTALGLSKHYVIDTIIDANGAELPTMGEFTGSITGTVVTEWIYENVNGNIVKIPSKHSNAGGITNFVISNPNKNNYGLFSSISSRASITNLTISGRIKVTTSLSDVNVGLICGENNGLIKNVHVTLFDSSVETTTNNAIMNVGGVCGINKGSIVVDIEDRKIWDLNTYYNDYADETSLESFEFDKAGGVGRPTINTFATDSTLMVHMPECLTIKGQSKNSYIGGVAGTNSGLIKFRLEQAIDRYNNYGVSAIVNINAKSDKSSFDNVGGISGLNKGIISNVMVKGTVNANEQVGGICGVLEGNVNNATSRTYVRGYNYVAGLVGNSTGTITNSTVQAIDDGIKVGNDVSLIIVYNGVSKTYHEIANGGTIQSTVAKSYITRNLAELDSESNQYVKIENNDTSKYYGDLIILGTESDNEKSNVYDRIQFNTGATESLKDLIKYTEKVVMIKIAKNAANQAFLKDANTINVPNIWKTETAPEVIVTSLNSNIISVTNDGKLRLLSTGVAELKIQNSLNAKDIVYVKIHVINYVEQLRLYKASNKTGEYIDATNNKINIINDEVVALYPSFYGGMHNTGNMLIELVENEQLKLINSASNNNIEIQTGNVIYIKGVSGESSSTTTVDFKIVYKNDTYTAYYYENLGFYQETELNDAEGATITPQELEIEVNYTRGIRSISLDKTNIKLVPSDKAKLKLTYETYDDSLTPILNVNIEKTGETVSGFTYDSETGKYVSTNAKFNKYFTILAQKSGSNGTFVLDITISLNINELINDGVDVTGIFNFTFTTEQSNIKKTLRVEYLPQVIDNVIAKNYSYTENKDIVQNSIYYNTSYSMVESNIVTAGEPNILRIYYNPVYAEFAYVEITNASTNSANARAQFSLLEKTTVDGNTVAKTTTKGYYLSNGIRINKEDITSEDIMVLYRIPTNVSQDEEMKLNICFYDEKGQIVYGVIEKTLVIKISKTIQVTIDGKTSETTEDSTFYRVARGYRYKLNVKTVGYSLSDIVITSTSNYAQIIKEGNDYFLQIADEISYTSTGSEGIKVTLEYYGRRLVEGKWVNDSKQTINCIIVEYVIDNLHIKELFEDSLLTINIGNTIDIRDAIVNKMTIEYSAVAQNSVDVLRLSLFNNADYWYRLGKNVDFVKINGDSTEVKAENGNPLILKGYDFTPIKILEEIPYSFGISAELEYIDGYIQVSSSVKENESEDKKPDIKEFNVEVSQNTSSENPWPIMTYEELLDMDEGGHYILMNDIEIPKDFVPITTKIASLDGNGHSIIFRHIAEYDNVNTFGLFEEVATFTNVNGKQVKMIVKNLDLKIKESASFNFNNTTSTSSLLFGLLCATNNGIITNCSVSYVQTASLKVNLSTSLSLSNSSFIAGLCGENRGYITNSRVEIKLETVGANMAGFVARNAGEISSCYVKNSSIKNTSTNPNNTTGGFVCVNEGNIFGSYISGNHDPVMTRIYANDNNYVLTSSTIAGGFIYNNTGKVEDCYSNIPIVASDRNAGFVAINSGYIERSYSTSKLGGLDTQNYPFVYINSKMENEFVDCFYLKDSVDINNNTSNTNKGIAGLTELSISQFISKDTFNVLTMNNNGDETQGVWFYPTNSLKESSVDAKFSYPVESSRLTYKDENLKFIARRPELVSANTLAYSSKRILESNTITDEETGETIYFYIDNYSYSSEGSKYNPIAIYSAQQFEDSVISRSYRGINESHYRLVCDIDYKEEGVISNLYNTNFCGYLDGNSFAIKNYSINSSTKLSNAGYFAQLGNLSKTTDAVVQNLDLMPRYINLPNAYNVGALCGKANKANVYNVNLSSETVILGRNIVGGLIGITNNGVEIERVNCSISVNAYYSTDYVYANGNGTEDQIPTSIFHNLAMGNSTEVSYAGACVGYVGGLTEIDYVTIQGDVASIGIVSGLAFGGSIANSSINNVLVKLSHNENNFVRASEFGGLVIGDSNGKLSNVVVIDENPASTNSLFKSVPKAPYAVGSVAGIVRNGTITNISSYVDMNTSNIGIVGGLIGSVFVKDGNINISDVNYNGTYISSSRMAGGIIGYVLEDSSSLELTLSNIKVGENKDGGNVKIYIKKLASQKSLNDGYQIFTGGVVACYNTPHLTTINITCEDKDFVGVDFEIQASITGATKEEGASQNTLVKIEDPVRIKVGGVLGGIYGSYSLGSDGKINIQSNTYKLLNLNMKNNSSIKMTLDVYFINLAEKDYDYKNITDDGLLLWANSLCGSYYKQNVTGMSQFEFNISGNLHREGDSKEYPKYSGTGALVVYEEGKLKQPSST